LGETQQPDRYWMDQAIAEHKMLQDKLDKIGSFKFMIRGWSITFISAALYAASSLKLPSEAFWVAPFFGVAFYLLERKQTNFANACSRRIVQIEKALGAVLRADSAANPAFRPLFDRLVLIPGLGASLLVGRRRPSSLPLLGRIRYYLSDDGIQFYLVALITLVVTVSFLQGDRPRQEQSPSPVYNTIVTEVDSSEPDVGKGGQKTDAGQQGTTSKGNTKN